MEGIACALGCHWTLTSAASARVGQGMTHPVMHPGAANGGSGHEYKSCNLQATCGDCERQGQGSEGSAAPRHHSRVALLQAPEVMATGGSEF